MQGNRYAVGVNNSRPSGVEMRAQSFQSASNPTLGQSGAGLPEMSWNDTNGSVFYIASCSRDQFEVARRRIRPFREFESFSEWEDARRWWQFGLCLAGVNALVVNVDLPLFARCRGGPLNPPQEAIRSFLHAKEKSLGD